MARRSASRVIASRAAGTRRRVSAVREGRGAQELQGVFRADRSVAFTEHVGDEGDVAIGGELSRSRPLGVTPRQFGAVSSSGRASSCLYLDERPRQLRPGAWKRRCSSTAIVLLPLNLLNPTIIIHTRHPSAAKQVSAAVCSLDCFVTPWGCLA